MPEFDLQVNWKKRERVNVDFDYSGFSQQFRILFYTKSYI